MPSTGSLTTRRWRPVPIPSPLGYRGFPKSVCTSVNEVICHGIPDSRRLAPGDIINIDVTVYREGVHGDTSATLMVGEVDEHSRRLVDETRVALNRGIGAVRAGAAVSEIGRAIEAHASRHRLGVVREFIGHGVGTEFHSGLQVPHYHDRRATTVLEEAMTFTIEPMLTLGSPQVAMWDDGWTAVTLDGRRTAQFEHTLVCTADGAEILTRTAARRVRPRPFHRAGRLAPALGPRGHVNRLGANLQGGADGLLHPVGHGLRVLMFPESQHGPAGLLQVVGGFGVPGDVAGDLVGPVLGVGGGLGVVLGAAVPVTAVHEHRDPALAQHQVCGAGKLRLGPGRHPEPHASPVHRGPYGQLGLGVAAPVALHRLAGSRRRSPRAPGHDPDHSGQPRPLAVEG